MKPLAAVTALVLALAAAGCGGSGDDEPAAAAAPPSPESGQTVRVGGSPIALAVGEGGVWVADNSGSKLVAVTGGKGEDYTAGSSSQVAPGPLAVAAGDGAVWTASGDGTITRVNPQGGEVTEASEKVPQPGGIAVGEGFVWVTSAATDTVARFDAQTGEAVDEIEVGALPADVVVGDGFAWVANTNDGTITRIDAASGEAEATIEVASQQVLALAYGEDAVWTAGTDDERAETIEVRRIEPGSDEPEAGGEEVDAGIPVDLAAGEGGVWVTLVGGSALPGSDPRGRVAVIDPSIGTVAGEAIEVGERPSAVGVGDGNVWVAAANGTLTQIEP